VRRLLTVAILAALVSTSAACSQADDSSPSTSATTGGAAATTPASSPSPTVDIAANTKAVCTKVEAIVTEANFKPIGEQIGLMIAARQQKNKTAETAAAAKAKELADGVAKQITDLKTEAADPKLDAALDQAGTGIQLFGSPDYLSKINSVADMNKLSGDFEKALTPLGTFCG
jgi:hypothetical protein